jgi:hypothetical protein
MNSLAGILASGIARLLPSGKQVDDPLANIKAATRWVEDLPTGDAFKCQQAIFGQIKRFNESSTQFTKDHLAIFMLLDEKSRDLQDTLVRQYLRNQRMSRQVESRLWHAVYGLYWEVARGYHTFVLHLAREAGHNRHDGLIPLTTLRAIRTFGQLLKWRAMRYLPAVEKLWLRLHNLYCIAEDEGFHRQPQRAYADDASECSCETAFQHILMLNQANSGTLYPKQIDLLDRWLSNWHELLHLDTHPGSNINIFVIDLSADHGPRRVRKPDTSRSMRFWNTSDLLLKLKDLQVALREGSTPAQLGLTESARTSESLELLEHLQHSWSSLADREQRRAPRKPIKRLVDVAHGLRAITSQIKAASVPASAPAIASPYGTGLNYKEEDDVHVYGFVTDRTRELVSHMHAPTILNSPEVERWVIHDESECGYGAIVESRDKDWLRVGVLIGIKSHNAREWQIGIVRRLSRVNGDTCSVGVETLAEPPVLAMLHDTSTPGYTVNGLDNNGTKQPHSSLWLAGSSGVDSVIIDPVHFVPGRVFQIHGVPERQFIALGNPIEHCEGWIRVVAEPVSH